MLGKFITFEGLDGSGKSTQVQRVADKLQQLGYELVISREPGGTDLAEKVRNIVLDAKTPLNNQTLALLFCAARSEHVEKLLRPSVAAGKLVLCDRFVDSTLIYQGFAANQTEAYIQKLYELNLFATQDFMPQLTVVLDADPEALLKRRQQRGVEDRFELKGLEFQKQLRQGFLSLAKKYPQRIQLVNALGTEEAVTDAIMEKILPLLR